LELKLIADVGLVGMPNAGKSTLLSAISAARPKIADYPFTTLEPQLGIVAIGPDRRMVVADIPGLIEGAHGGAGLGVAFLRHIERTKVIVHLLDLYPLDGSEPADNYRIIRRELESFSPELAAKPEIIAANKMDLALDDEAIDRLGKELPGNKIYPISGATHRGLDRLLESLWELVHPQVP
jgi:GTP-binding protein